MRTPDIVLRAGDRLPIVARNVTIEGVAVNLTGYTGIMWVQALTGSTNLLAVPAATIDPDQVGNTGGISYQFTAGDVSALPAGVYSAWFEVTSSSRTLSAPNDGFLVLEVIADGAAVWSYSGSPSGRPLDKVRYLIGDTNPSDQKVSDAEILFELAEANDSPYYAAANCAETIAGTASASAVQSKSVGDLSLSYNWDSQAKRYTDLAARLRSRAMRAGAVTFVAGGVDADRIFRIGMTDSPPGQDDYSDLTTTSLVWGV